MEAKWIKVDCGKRIPNKSHNHSAVVIGNEMYMISEWDDSADNLIVLWKFTPTGDTTGVWTQIYYGYGPSLGISYSAVVIDDEIYIFGGWNGSCGEFNALWKFTPTSDTTGEWVKIICGSNVPSGRWSYSAVVINNEMYMFGGCSRSFFNNFNDLWKFTPTSNTTGIWIPISCKNHKPVTRCGHSAVVIDNKMYMFGGKHKPSYLNDLWKFMPISNTAGAWIPIGCKSNRLVTRCEHSAVVIDDEMYIFGGRGGSNFNDLWKFIPLGYSLGKWVKIDCGNNVPDRRYAHSAVVINNEMYMFGGESGSSYFNDLWKLVIL